MVIALAWVTSVLISIASSVFLRCEGVRGFGLVLLTSFNAIYMHIDYFCFAHVRCGAQPQHHGEASRESKLTMTLLMVAGVSLLMYLPAEMLYLILSI